jgi:hypothetical protein
MPPAAGGGGADPPAKFGPYENRRTHLFVEKYASDLTQQRTTSPRNMPSAMAKELSNKHNNKQ